MITTVLAIYGAAVATGSLLFSWWAFVASGPKIQAKAELLPPPWDPDGAWAIDLQVWTGRQAVKLNIGSVHVLHRLERSKTADMITLKWDGPDLPMMMPANSFEQWYCKDIGGISKVEGRSGDVDTWKRFGIDLAGQVELETKANIYLEVGGKLGKSGLSIPLRPASDMRELGFQMQDFWNRYDNQPNSEISAPSSETADEEYSPS